MRDKTVRELQVPGGETLKQVINVGGLGKVRFKVTWDGESPTEDELRLLLYYSDDEEYACDAEMVRPGVFEAKLGEGVYNLEITDGYYSQWVEELEVSGGQTLEMEIEVTLPKE